jgi:transcriptional regulator with XRE-family HTH domain
VKDLMPPEDVVKLLPPDDGDSYTTLYRMYDSDGQLLYVGIAPLITVRMGEHRRTARWFRDVTRIDIEHYDTRQSAIDAESQAIRTENPRYNLQDTGRRIAWDGIRLKRARELAGLTQAEAARAVSLSPTTIAKYEQNKAQPSIPALADLARLLNVSSDVLLGLTPDEKLDQYTGPEKNHRPTSIGEGMRNARVQRGFMKQAQLAEKAGIHLYKIQMFEHNTRTPTPDELEKIAQALDVDPAWLVPVEKEGEK